MAARRGVLVALSREKWAQWPEVGVVHVRCFAAADVVLPPGGVLVVNLTVDRFYNMAEVFLVQFGARSFD